ncbi:MAG TPA: glycosyl hydrolase family 28 protein [Bacteroidales bacterium]
MKLRIKLFYIISIFAGLAYTSIKAATLPVIPTIVFNITSYGAVSSTTVDNTGAIQQTINTCSAAGGGIVVIPAGTFLSGPISMKNNINLQISAGATLTMLPYGSGNGTVPGTYPNSGTTDDYTDFIYGKNITNIEVSGSGTIEGQGSDWWTAYKANNAISRPCMIRFDGCTNIAILGITLQNAPNVHITIGKSSSNATISGITINAPSTSPNTDGIDTWAPNIDINNCTIACGDDNIAMDSGSQNITIKHCAFGVGHGCSIGSYASGITNIKVDSCTFNGTTSGIRMKSNRTRGGVEQNLSYSNITMTGVTNPIYITSYYPSAPSSPSSDPAQAVTSTTPSWTHITLKNIIITGSSNAGILWGLPEQSISDIVLDNVKISATSGMKAYFVTGLIFKNGSSITVTGNAITTYNASITGINLSTGKPSYVISATASPASSGTVSGTGTFTYNQAVSLTATPSAGFAFTKWTEGSKDVSTSMTLTFEADSDRLLVANFSTATGTLDLQDDQTVSVFPNPNHGEFTLQLDNNYSGEATVTIWNESGILVKQLKIMKVTQRFTQDLTVKDLPIGSYFVKIQEGNDNIVKHMIVL